MCSLHSCSPYRPHIFNTTQRYLQTFSDDSAVVERTGGGREENYRGLVDGFVEWAGVNNLLLNVDKTKEMVILMVK